MDPKTVITKGFAHLDDIGRGARLFIFSEADGTHYLYADFSHSPHLDVACDNVPAFEGGLW